MSPAGDSPDTCVAVYDEPQHEPVLRNAYAYVYRVRLPAGGQTLWHRHTEDTVYFSLAEAVGREEFPAAEPVVTPLPCGVAVSRPHKAEPLVHQVSNAGETAFHLVGAEALAAPTAVTAERPAADADVTLETPRFRVWRLRQPSAWTLPAAAGAGLLVAADGACRWTDGGDDIGFDAGFDGFFAAWR
ncbi:MAG: hypothetical protein ACU85V_06710 [Gammaproteobacteria bacterium]